MANKRSPSLLYILFLVLFVVHCHCIGDDGDKKVYIVYMGELPKDGVSAAHLHKKLLEDVIGSSAAAKESLVYSYGRSFNGFAARLSDEEAAMFEEMEQVVSVLPNTMLQLHTTRSWDFVGFPQFQSGHSNHEGDIIVGVLDSGIWPESESFKDDGVGLPPAKWKGMCQSENNFTCNNKLIGARYYNSYGYDPTDFQSPRDSLGHGTHTSSTAGGKAVDGVNFFGLGAGVARGAVPNARIAVYKVCWALGCSASDILAAFDDAIADGVDIISVSLGTQYAIPFFYDPLAIGAFHAMKNGVLSSMSAGNSGPDLMSAVNIAPWALTVAANTIDRKFVTQVVLGNGDIIMGHALNTFTLSGTFPLIDGGVAPNISAGFSHGSSRQCKGGWLNSNKVEGTIVLCDRLWDGSGVLLANGIGVIMHDSDYADLSFAYPLPATHISDEDGTKILNYIQSSNNPTATILHGADWKDVVAPRVASFSGRGPNYITPDILKPDLTAPGVNILAAWSPVAIPSISYLDTRHVDYNIISGTSMSCPHVTGAAAYVKSFHPTWSPAAIKSALMTTATVMGPNKNDEAEFAYGSGQIRPLQAVDPGLVFDASEKDYVDFLCKQGYNSSTVKLITGDSSNCSSTGIGKVWDLNYPSFALSIQDRQPISGYFTRSVTNVGSPNSTYYVKVDAPSSLEVTVTPTVLSFSSIGEAQSFSVKVTGGVISQQPIISASIVWRDDTHSVRSPLVVYTIVSTPIVTPRTRDFSSFSTGPYRTKGPLRGN